MAGKEYILGVDGGSTTTKACLIDIETSEITASFYGRTHGDPVKALKNCFVEMQKQIKDDTGAGGINITLAATTGSSRELLGVFLETPAVYNEIIAHSVGTTFYKEDIDTLFEIGGQDAKYVFLKNKVPIDYAMNEACSAGTGSFLGRIRSGGFEYFQCNGNRRYCSCGKRAVEIRRTLFRLYKFGRPQSYPAGRIKGRHHGRHHHLHCFQLSQPGRRQ